MKKKDYNEELKKIIIEYFNNSKKKPIFFCDIDKKINLSIFEKKVYSYKNQLEKIWIKFKLKRNLAILTERNIDYLALIFAAWLAKGYYLPLSKLSPQKNIDYQIRCSNISVVAKNFCKKNKFFSVKKKKIKKKYINNDDTAYTIFTSGSTGKKKGVIISKKAFIKYLDSLKKTFKNNKKLNSLIINGEMTFDISLADIAFAIIFQSGVAITDNSKNIISLLYMLKFHQIHSLYVVPSTLERIVHYLEENKNFKLPNLLQINSGGELLNMNLIKRAKKMLRKTVFYNFYGPTEFTINATYHKINFKKKYESDSVPIGKVFPGINYKITKKKEK